MGLSVILDPSLRYRITWTWEVQTQAHALRKECCESSPQRLYTLLQLSLTSIPHANVIVLLHLWLRLLTLCQCRRLVTRTVRFAVQLSKAPIPRIAYTELLR